MCDVGSEMCDAGFRSSSFMTLNVICLDNFMCGVYKYTNEQPVDYPNS